MSKNHIFFNKFDNKNSLTRDELATERSFLAYIRTGVSFLIASFSITQAIQKIIIDLAIELLNNESDNTGDFEQQIKFYKKLAKPVSLVFCTLSLFVCSFGLKRYLVNLKFLARYAKFNASRYGMIILFATLFAINILLLYHSIIYGIKER